jgi:alanyl-tRNA synthetase
LAFVQKCVRTGDIDEVGDDTHLTFFEMLGNFSFGGYWKKEAIAYAHEFITKELGLTIDYVSVFKDDESGIPADEESRKIWQEIDSTLTIKDHNRSDNFWGPTGDEGPCGPTTEIYINGVEIWNIVFNEFYKTTDGKYEPLKIKGIDTGMGLERLLVQVQKKQNVYETDLFENIVKIISDISAENRGKSVRIVADHMRTALFMTMDNVIPSSKDAGYVLRKIIRRAWTHVKVKLGATHVIEDFLPVLDYYVSIYQSNYPNLLETKNNKYEIILGELNKFDKTLKSGIEELKKYYHTLGIGDPENKPESCVIAGNTIRVSGLDIFNLYQTHGLPIEVSQELMTSWGLSFDDQTMKEAQEAFIEHQKLSRTSSAGMFKGGLANHEPKTIQLHTAHHLLLAALQEVLGKEVKQRGSNITEERLRIDFAFDRKMTDEEKKKVEDIVNDNISRKLNVLKKEMPKEEAEKLGAEMEFGAKYGDIVSVYVIEDENGNHISKEFCGGPHVENTGELGHFKIQKEEASSAGVRRIKALLE